MRGTEIATHGNETQRPGAREAEALVNVAQRHDAWGNEAEKHEMWRYGA